TADVDRLRRPQAQRKCGEYSGGERAARGLGEEVSAALPLSRCPTVFHRHLPWRYGARCGANPGKNIFRKRLLRLFCPLRKAVGKLYTKLYVRLQTECRCLTQPRCSGRDGANRTEEGFSGFA